MGIFAPDGKLAGFLNALGNLIVLNILTLICSIPIFTFGASMTALYTMVMRMARKEDGKIISEYFKAFKANFKPATILWLIFGGLIAFMTFDIWLLRSITGNIWNGIPCDSFCDHTDLRNGTDSYFCSTGTF